MTFFIPLDSRIYSLQLTIYLSLLDYLNPPSLQHIEFISESVTYLPTDSSYHTSFNQADGQIDGENQEIVTEPTLELVPFAVLSSNINKMN